MTPITTHAVRSMAELVDHAATLRIAVMDAHVRPDGLHVHVRTGQGRKLATSLGIVAAPIVGGVSKTWVGEWGGRSLRITAPVGGM